MIEREVPKAPIRNPELLSTFGMYEMEAAAVKILAMCQEADSWDVPIWFEDIDEPEDYNHYARTGLLHLLAGGFVIPNYPNGLFRVSESFVERIYQNKDKEYK